MEHGVKYRDMWTQVGLMIITIGFYSVYWFYQTAMELKFLNKDPNANPALWTVLLFIPFGGIYSWYKYASLYELESQDHLNRWILFLLWIVFCPATWFIVQTELNRRATWNFPAARS